MFDGARKTLIKALDPKGRYSRGFVDIWSESADQGIAPQGLDRQDLYRVYKQSSLVRGVIDTVRRGAIAKGIGLVPATKNPGEENHKVLEDFFSFPNPEEDMVTIIGDIVTDLMVFGNAYVEVVKDNGTPVALYNMDAIYTKIRATSKGQILGYVLEIPGKPKVKWDADGVIHFKLTSRGSEIYGLPKLESLINTVDADLKAQLYISAYFDNYGAPKGLYMMEEGTEEDIGLAREFLKDQASESNNAHRSILVKGKMTYQNLATSFREAQILELRQFHRDEILSIYGVPPSKAQYISTGNIGAGTGTAQDRTFKEETIIPLQQKIANKINYKVIQEMFDIHDWEFVFNPILIEDRNTLAQIHKIYTGIGVLTTNEVREELGKEPVDEEELEGEGGEADVPESAEDNDAGKTKESEPKDK